MRKSKQLLCRCCRCVFGNYPLTQYEHNPGFPGENPALPPPVGERTTRRRQFSATQSATETSENSTFACLLPVLQTFFVLQQLVKHAGTEAQEKVC